jgi:DNA polymerase III delta prime subunit
MEQLNINKILHREKQYTLLKNALIYFEQNKHLLNVSRGFYVYGNPGVGKTLFVRKILKDLGYDVIMFDSSDLRNKHVIDTITKHNMSDRTILSMFTKKPKKIAIIMDEIDSMNIGDKSGITALINLIRAKKTKKQKLESSTIVPVICIGNNHRDKKIKELIKVCTNIYIESPTDSQIKHIINLLMPTLDHVLIDNLTKFIAGDLRKLSSSYNIYIKQHQLLKNEIIQNIFQSKINSEDTKHITKNLLNTRIKFNEHNIIINETNRTSIGLLFHENIIDVLHNAPVSTNIPFYIDVLDTMCYSDYIDRITFQKQVWIFNEISSLMKTIHCNNKLHDYMDDPINYNPNEVRFTKVLTKYSTEYNNMTFIQTLCKKLNMDKKDMLTYFLHLQNEYSMNEIYIQLEPLEIQKLHVDRIYKFIDRYTLNSDE